MKGIARIRKPAARGIIFVELNIARLKKQLMLQDKLTFKPDPHREQEEFEVMTEPLNSSTRALS